jgi:hypothetical protein
LNEAWEEDPRAAATGGLVLIEKLAPADIDFHVSAAGRQIKSAPRPVTQAGVVLFELSLIDDEGSIVSQASPHAAATWLVRSVLVEQVVADEMSAGDLDRGRDRGIAVGLDK